MTKNIYIILWKINITKIEYIDELGIYIVQQKI